MAKKFKSYMERRDDALAVGDPIWVFSGADVYESVVVEAGMVLSTDRAPFFYQVRLPKYRPTEPDRTSKEYRTDLYRRPAELEELIDAVEQAHEELGKWVKKLEDVRWRIEEAEQEAAAVAAEKEGQ